MASAIAPTHDRLMNIHGASHLTIRGITFSHSEWNFPEPILGQEPQTGGFGQAAIGVTAAVSLEDCRDCRIESCRFEHLGNYALELGKGCQGDVIDHCTFTDLGSGGMKIGEQQMREASADQTFGNTVTDCRITDGGHMFPSACGIWVGQSYDNNLSHNELADLYYTAISLGWTWGYGPSLCRGNKVEANLIHHIGKKSDGDGPILSDMGAVYTLGARPGTVIAGNYFHDINARIYGGWGIYLDEGSSGLLIENNLVTHTTHGGFHLHYGTDNVLQNNIFALNRDLQIARTRDDPGLNFTFNHNIVYWDTGVFTRTDGVRAEFDNNLYWCFGQGKLQFGQQTWNAWQSAGQDVHSILADPRFGNPARGDFNLRDGSPAEKIGFEPIDASDAGVRK
jgi:parallel beta-helix repeat protein